MRHDYPPHWCQRCGLALFDRDAARTHVRDDWSFPGTDRTYFHCDVCGDELDTYTGQDIAPDSIAELEDISVEAPRYYTK